MIAAIAAGGWVAVVVIIVLCLVALIAGSVFGIFFSGEDSGTGMSMQTVVQEINQEYEKLFKLLKDRHDSKQTSDKEEKTSYYNNMKYDFSEDAKLRETLNKVINFTGVTIEIIGEWIWISGNTYQYKKDLKEIGFR